MNGIVYQAKTGKAIKKPTGKAPAKAMKALKNLKKIPAKKSK